MSWQDDNDYHKAECACLECEEGGNLAKAALLVKSEMDDQELGGVITVTVERDSMSATDYQELTEG